MSSIDSYNLLLSANNCYDLLLISVIIRSYLIADSICYCQLQAGIINYYLFFLLPLSITICYYLVTFVIVCCFSLYLLLSFIVCSDLWLSAINWYYLLQSANISYILWHLWLFSTIFHHLASIWYYLRLLVILFYYLPECNIFCYDLLLSAMFS